MALLCARIPAGPGQPRSSPISPLSSLAQGRTHSSSRDQRWEAAETLYECLRNGRMDPHLPKPPLQKLPAPGKHQRTEIRPERNKATEMKGLATKQMWLLHRDPALGPNNSLRKGLQAKGNFHPRGILPVGVSRGFDTFPQFREEPAPPEHCSGEPECVPAPVLWKPKKMKPFLLLRN